MWVQKDEEEGGTFMNGPGILVSSSPLALGRGQKRGCVRGKIVRYNVRDKSY